MLLVKSFLRKNDNFVPVSDFIGGIPDSDYIEGAIEIFVQQKGLLTLEAWDYVDQLWCYFVDGLFEVVEGKEFETYLPDQPLKVVFRPDRYKRRVTIEVGDDETRSASVEYGEFMHMMTEEGIAFFHRLAELVPGSRTFYKEMAQRLSLLEKKN